MSNDALTRRRFLLLVGGGAATVAGGVALLRQGGGTDPPSLVTPQSREVAAAEQRRRGAGTSRMVDLAAVAGTVELAGRQSPAWTYGGSLPGPEIRVTAGDTIAATFRNELAVPTTIHWHGLALRNDMDGVPGVTQPEVEPGATFRYEFVAPDPGTYFFHPHVGTQLDRGLYAPLIVEDPSEPGDYDVEAVLVLDDWLGGDPDETLRQLQSGSMPGMDHGGMPMAGDAGTTSMAHGQPSGTGMGPDTGDVAYRTFLVNGRPPDDPFVVAARPGDTVRLRIVNAGSDRPFRFAVGGHRLTVTHSDGFPVVPRDGDVLLIGMGERYDVSVRVTDAVAPIVAVPDGLRTGALALLRSGAGLMPSPSVRPPALDGELLTAADLIATDTVRLARRPPDRTVRYRLDGDMMTYRWTINGRPLDAEQVTDPPTLIHEGERVRLRFENRTMMLHPMHLHGHTFQLGDGGARKDTAIIQPGTTLEVDFDADNPGQWVVHCHNIYHAEAGMAAVLGYAR